MSAPLMEDKAFATLQAKAALIGVALVRSKDEASREIFIASKLAVSRQLESAGEVERLLVRMAGEAS